MCHLFAGSVLKEQECKGAVSFIPGIDKRVKKGDRLIIHKIQELIAPSPAWGKIDYDHMIPVEVLCGPFERMIG